MRTMRHEQPDWTVEPTAEMTRWARRLGGTLRPGSVVGMLLVTPIAHVANRSFGFQAYLYDVFHRSAAARIGHTVCMPAIVAAALGAAFSVHAGVGVVVAAALAAWHVAVARREGLLGLGVTMVGLIGLLSVVGAWWSAAATVWWAHPVIHVFTLGFLQTLSHAAEAEVPPRVSGHTRWTATKAFFAERPFRHGVRSAVMLVAGTANEVWASWRLLHVVALDLLFALGYRADLRAARQAVLRDACADGNPAIDYIGRGGATEGPW